MNIVLNSGRKNSSDCEIHFLAEYGNVIISDNHRFAPWYWANYINMSAPHTLIHIDHHYDDNTRELDNAVMVLPDLKSITVNEFLETKLNTFDTCAVYWANIISFFHEYSKTLEKIIINEGAINQDSDIQFEFWDLFQLPTKIQNYKSKFQTILDVDFDFFVNDDYNFLDTNPQYIFDFFSAIEKNIKEFEIITIALSPASINGKWESIESIMDILRTVFNTNFVLPQP